MSERYGTSAWAARGGGRLTRGEQGLEALRGVKVLAEVEADRLARALGLGRRAFHLALAEVPLPRSPLAEAAQARLARTPAWNVGHSMRTWLWGALLGKRDGVAVDAELLFAAAALHDLGLTDEGPQPCFAHRGAELARATCLSAGASPERAAAVADAICQHLNVVPSGPPEARLVRAGAGYDVVGDRFFELSRDVRVEVVAVWPRRDFAAVVSKALEGEAGRHPGTRVEFLCHHLHFPALIARADRWFVRDATGPVGVTA